MPLLQEKIYTIDDIYALPDGICGMGGSFDIKADQTSSILTTDTINKNSHI